MAITPQPGPFRMASVTVWMHKLPLFAAQRTRRQLTSFFLGELYVFFKPTNAAANLVPVTWDVASITGENWVANATLLNGTSPGSLYIMHEAFDAVGVSNFAAISSLGGKVTGFGSSVLSCFSTTTRFSSRRYAARLVRFP